MSLFFRFTILAAALVLAGCNFPGSQVEQPTPFTTEQPTPPEAQPSPMPGTLEPTPTNEPEETAGLLAYIGTDENVWLVNPSNGEQQQLTHDGATFQPGAERETTSYSVPQWSSDGRLLAFRKEVGTPTSQGYDFTFDLWVYDAASAQLQVVLAGQQVIGYAWQPGTWRIAYALPIDNQYFGRSGPATEYAQGIWVVDVETGNSAELVEPERGYTLVNPVWSPDGRLLSFEEVLYMEGRGKFAYYDMEAQQYVAWDEVLGFYSWSPDGEQITFDQLAYVPSGTERIFLRERQSQNEQVISPQLGAGGYAFMPVFSPQGDRIAYLADRDGMEGGRSTLMVSSLQSGETLQLGEFEGLWNLAWSPDGSRVAITTGPYESRRVVEVSLADGSARALGEGSQAAWQP